MGLGWSSDEASWEHNSDTGTHILILKINTNKNNINYTQCNESYLCGSEHSVENGENRIDNINMFDITSDTFENVNMAAFSFFPLLPLLS